ncbi:phosphate/phosphite/phosphonate ABC transporter substrate-binding protein [Desulfopila sp. IMCC35008]|uniref:phosphate/phosphite/phosphonate ABC transporter substrate-binding protein n=1 Tax=Desulfopila sp. IMCC35008 TaxID=2653858 RepID=UPI0013D0D317|nr:phosphate/phosphite/phosphonate ABC transporter substrate-binding protein [Desulfopila sp. IMCC35008]
MIPRKLLHIYLFFSIITAALTVYAGAAGEKIVRIGVLAFRTPEKTMERWRPTADSLTLAIPGYKFVILPMKYPEINPAVENKTIDFVLTNTGHYVELEANQGIARMVTLVKSIDGLTTKKFGGVLFTRADRDDINTIEDLKNKNFLAVTRSSLGGFLVAWEEFLKHDLDPFADFGSLTFNGLPQDDIVFKVLNKEADAGTVRTSVLEQMEQEGQIRLADFKIINPLSTRGFPYIHSTALYPEWPFSSLSHVDDELVEKVTVALLSLKKDNPAAIAGNYDRWVPPLDYQSVHTLFTALNIGPYEKFNTITVKDILDQYLLETSIILGFLLLIMLFVVKIVHLNRSLKTALSEVRTLQGMIPICSSCKKIRDDQGDWNKIESYVSKHADARFSHGYCPACYQKELEKMKQWADENAESEETS